MPTANWSKVTQDAITAAQAALGGAWSGAAQAATAQISALVHVAQYVEANQDAMTPAEYQFLVAQQKQAVQNVLTSYQAIGLAAAQNAIAAAINAVIKDAPGLVGIL